jgi:hypothetical protein
MSGESETVYLFGGKKIVNSLVTLSSDMFVYVRRGEGRRGEEEKRRRGGGDKGRKGGEREEKGRKGEVEEGRRGGEREERGGKGR